MQLPFAKTISTRSKIQKGYFVLFQVIPFISIPPWFLFWLLFNAGNPVSERNVSFVIYFLFGTLWHVPLFFVLDSIGMWLAIYLRYKRLALVMGVALCLPLAAFFIILLMQYIEAH